MDRRAGRLKRAGELERLPGGRVEQAMHTEKPTGQKRYVRNGVLHLIILALAIAVQVVWIVLLVQELLSRYAAINTIVQVIAVIIVLAVYSSDKNSAYRLPWIVIILAFPVLGVILYAMFRLFTPTKAMGKRQAAIDEELFLHLKPDAAVAERLQAEDQRAFNQCNYLRRYGYFPVYDDTRTSYYADTTDALAAMKEELAKAKSFIFMEYLAIEDAEAFGELLEIMAQKAKEGVEVRVFYDDFGSFTFINNKDFIKRMNGFGIQCRVFNPAAPWLKVEMNNRDHRKMTIIDGHVGFTGGYNLANEYFNYTSPYGHWKDAGLKLTGGAVRTMTVLFLEMWNAVRATDKDDEEFSKYFPEIEEISNPEYGYVQPYGDSPLDNEHTGENVYMNVINNAKDYLYISTPYLEITDDMNRCIGLAAKRGVDVRIITPGIPDKKLVYSTTRSYYSGLIRRGVRIFEYTPGFCHAKVFVSDDTTAVVGSINLDYRSLYLQFENAVWMYKVPAVADVRKDFEDLFPQCREVTEKYRRENISIWKRIWYCVLRLFAPLF